MNRREFLTVCGSAAASLTLPASAAVAQQATVQTTAHKWRGVNLGSWLALEKWISPAVYAGTSAEDEYSLCLALGKSGAAERLKHHRDTWITEADFKWIAARGMNAVRLPIGYGILDENPPFVTGADVLDRAFAMAKAQGLSVLLDLHGAPGSQNGFDHSGRAGNLGWHANKQNVDHTVRIIENLAAYCKKFDNLIALELLNEPRWDVPMDILKKYYEDAYAAARKHLSADSVSIVIHDGFRSREWAGYMPAARYPNVILDTHLYQCYTDEDRKRDAAEHIHISAVDLRKQLADVQREALPAIVGEWSCSLDPHSLTGLSGFSLDTAIRAYADAQLLTYETTRGWFYWTYKIADGGTWSFRDCVKRGWMPDKYGDNGLA
jgi:glucan 1,3-beta-glucosidase